MCQVSCVQILVFAVLSKIPAPFYRRDACLAGVNDIFVFWARTSNTTATRMSSMNQPENRNEHQNEHHHSDRDNEGAKSLCLVGHPVNHMCCNSCEYIAIEVLCSANPKIRLFYSSTLALYVPGSVWGHELAGMRPIIRPLKPVSPCYCRWLTKLSGDADACSSRAPSYIHNNVIELTITACRRPLYQVYGSVFPFSLGSWNVCPRFGGRSGGVCVKA